MGKGMLLVALGCGRLPGTFEINMKHPFVVFGTMGGKVLADLMPIINGNMEQTLSVYFYETG